METYKIAENKMFHAAGHDFIFLAADNTIFEMDDRTKGLLDEARHGAKFSPRKRPLRTFLPAGR